MTSFINFNEVEFNSLDFKSMIFEAPPEDSICSPIKDLNSIGKFTARSSNETLKQIFSNSVFFVAGLTTLYSLIKIKDLSIPFLQSNNKTAFLKNVISKINFTVTLCAVACLILTLRKIVSVAIGYIIYPAALNSLNLELCREDAGKALKWVNPITLSKNGVDYEGFLFGPDEKNLTDLTNGNWIQVAGGNAWIAERAIVQIAEKFKGKNVLFINGPSAGRSSGVPTTDNMIAAQEAGLEFLEDVVKAKKILLYGTSLGAGVQAETLSIHTFKKDVQYMVWSDRTFDTLSNAASALVTLLAKPAFFILGIELDGVKGAKKLQELNIPHIVTQHNQKFEENAILAHEGPIDASGTDGIISNKASLYVGLRNNHIDNQERIKFFGNSDVPHNGPLPIEVERKAQEAVSAFFAS